MSLLCKSYNLSLLFQLLNFFRNQDKMVFPIVRSCSCSQTSTTLINRTELFQTEFQFWDIFYNSYWRDKKKNIFVFICLYICLESIYKFGLSVCLSVCPFVSNKRQNGWTDRPHIFCGTSHDPREGLWMIEFSKICLHQNSVFENFENPRNFFLKIREIFFFVIC